VRVFEARANLSRRRLALVDTNKDTSKDIQKEHVAGPAIVGTEGLHHYTISVANLDESVEWYSRVLGFRLIYQNKRHPWGQVGYMEGPGFLLELFEAPNPRPLPSYSAGPEPDTDLLVCGHKHFALLCRNVAEAVEELEALGQEPLSFKRVDLEGIGEFVAAFIADNTGALIELPEDPTPRRSPRSDDRWKQGPLRLTRLHHIAVCVPDREEAVRWYGEVFGFSLATSFEVPVVGLRSAMMRGPGFWLEIHSMAGSKPVPTERQSPQTDVQTLGNKYFALAVRDAASASRQLADAGVGIVASETAPGVHRLFIRDNAGNPIELFQLVN
jgi:methylmalonyl-CoA/ethylmalonyl-CoA epimerase